MITINIPEWVILTGLSLWAVKASIELYLEWRLYVLKNRYKELTDKNNKNDTD